MVQPGFDLQRRSHDCRRHRLPTAIPPSDQLEPFKGRDLFRNRHLNGGALAGAAPEVNQEQTALDLEADHAQSVHSRLEPGGIAPHVAQAVHGDCGEGHAGIVGHVLRQEDDGDAPGFIGSQAALRVDVCPAVPEFGKSQFQAQASRKVERREDQHGHCQQDQHDGGDRAQRTVKEFLEHAGGSVGLGGVADGGSRPEWRHVETAGPGELDRTPCPGGRLRPKDGTVAGGRRWSVCGSVERRAVGNAGHYIAAIRVRSGAQPLCMLHRGLELPRPHGPAPADSRQANSSWPVPCAQGPRHSIPGPVQLPPGDLTPRLGVAYTPRKRGG